jgi:sodium-dependent dicarboxylate transporter 2/3/5
MRLVDACVGPSKDSSSQKVFRFVCLLAGPVAMIPFLFNILDEHNTRMNRCAGVTLWLAIWWMSEACHITLTALLPIVLFPLFGVVDAATVSASYLGDMSFLYVGTIFTAIAMQRWGLHKRFALKVLTIVGTRPAFVLLGFMMCTYFVSWWLNNTASTAMMLPVAQAVVESFGDSGNVDKELQVSTGDGHVAFSKSVLLAVAYASSIGGISTLTGTGTNLVLVGQVNELFPKRGEISFAQWMAFAVPLSFILMLLMWALFHWQYTRHVKTRVDSESVHQRYRELGPISYEEIGVLCTLCVCILLWLFRNPPGCSGCGWSSLFRPYAKWYGVNAEKVISDGTVSFLCGLALFFIPAKNTRIGHRLLEWDYASKYVPWDIIMLLGGGFALAEAFSATHFTDWISVKLGGMVDLSPYLILSLVVASVTILTEFTSNVATASIVIPIVASTSVAMKINPLFLMVPAAVSCSFAFCLPVATPPNALVFSMGILKIKDMLKSGVFMNTIGIVVNILWMAAAGKILGIDLDHFPSWAEPDE